MSLHENKCDEGKQILLNSIKTLKDKGYNFAETLALMSALLIEIIEVNLENNEESKELVDKIFSCAKDFFDNTDPNNKKRKT